MNTKKWFKNCIIAIVSAIVLIFALVLLVDPFFHYHKPIFKYKLIEPRYINDGISRHFDFDAVITGTSMSQNFKPSQMDVLFGTNSVKMSYEGAGYEELSACLERTLKRNPQVKTVLWTVDHNGLLRTPDWSQYSDYPTYLYDDNPLNDAPYVYNKYILYHALVPDVFMTLKGQDSMSMDEYASWDEPTGINCVYGGKYDDDDILPMEMELSEAEAAQVAQTFDENILSVVQAHPDTTFYIFITPYSMYNWYRLWATGQTYKYIEAQRIATERMLECPNVKLYTFFEHHEVIENLDNYRDEAHYAPWINEQIMNWIYEGEGLVTKENYEERIKTQADYYLNFDYDAWIDEIDDAYEE